MTEEIIKIITNPDNFQERVLEVMNTTSQETVKNVISKIKRALYKDKDYVALCAPQIGDDVRLFVVKTANRESDKFKVFLNPMIVSWEGMHLSRETNASFPGKEFIIPRKDKIHLAYQTWEGKVSSETYTGAYAEVIQQMVEMLDGITLEDYGLELDDSFNKASKKKQQEIIDAYLEALKQDSADLTKEIEETPSLKYLDDTIKFTTGMLEGNITPINPVDKDGKPVELKDKK